MDRKRIAQFKVYGSQNHSTSDRKSYLVGTHEGENFNSSVQLRKNSSYIGLVEITNETRNSQHLVEVVSSSSAVASSVIESWKSQGYTEEFPEEDEGGLTPEEFRTLEEGTILVERRNGLKVELKIMKTRDGYHLVPTKDTGLRGATSTQFPSSVLGRVSKEYELYTGKATSHNTIRHQ